MVQCAMYSTSLPPSLVVRSDAPFKFWVTWSWQLYFKFKNGTRVGLKILHVLSVRMHKQWGSSQKYHNLAWQLVSFNEENQCVFFCRNFHQFKIVCLVKFLIGIEILQYVNKSSSFRKLLLVFKDQRKKSGKQSRILVKDMTGGF